MAIALPYLDCMSWGKTKDTGALPKRLVVIQALRRVCKAVFCARIRPKLLQLPHDVARCERREAAAQIWDEWVGACGADQCIRRRP